MISETDKEHKERINKAVDYILKNRNEDVSLDLLASIANYSPFHFQKIFKKVKGLTPKQFVIQIKLEAAIHLLIVHPNKSILEIAQDCGFSSASVFSRAFRNYYDTSPERFRFSKQNKLDDFGHKLKMKSPVNFTPMERVDSSVVVKKSSLMKGIYLMAPIHDKTKIQKAFVELYQMTKAKELLDSNSKFYGIMSPNFGHSYMAFLSLADSNIHGIKGNFIEVGAGRFAAIKTKGGFEKTMTSVHHIFDEWLPDSGYRVANNVVGFETFDGNPTQIEYELLEREIHVPIEAQ